MFFSLKAIPTVQHMYNIDKHKRTQTGKKTPLGIQNPTFHWNRVYEL